MRSKLQINGVILFALILCLGCRSGQEIGPKRHYEYRRYAGLIDERRPYVRNVRGVDYAIPRRGGIVRLPLELPDTSLLRQKDASAWFYFYVNGRERTEPVGVVYGEPADREVKWRLAPAHPHWGFPREGIVGDWYDIRFDDSLCELTFRLAPNGSGRSRTVYFDFWTTDYDTLSVGTADTIQTRVEVFQANLRQE